MSSSSNNNRNGDMPPCKGERKQGEQSHPVPRPASAHQPYTGAGFWNPRPATGFTEPGYSGASQERPMALPVRRHSRPIQPGQPSLPVKKEEPSMPALSELPSWPIKNEQPSLPSPFALPSQPMKTEQPSLPNPSELPQQPSGAPRPRPGHRATSHQVRREQQRQRQQQPGSSTAHRPRKSYMDREMAWIERKQAWVDRERAYLLKVQAELDNSRSQREDKAYEHYPTPQNSRGRYEHMTCGNCGKQGHVIRFCVHPSKDGFVHGCPSCNRKDHEGNCPNGPKSLHTMFERAVVDRQRRPPLAAYKDWPAILRRAEAAGIPMPSSFPWMPSFIDSIPEIFEPGGFPWETYVYRDANISTLPVDAVTMELRYIHKNFSALTQELNTTQISPDLFVGAPRP